MATELQNRVLTGLENNQDLLNNILTATEIGAGIIADRVFVEANHIFCDMMGYSGEELIGRKSSLLYPSMEEFERVGKIKYEQIKAEGRGTVETRLVRKDGKVLDIRVSSVPIDPLDLSKGVVFTTMDISEKKKAERERDSSRSHSANLIRTSPMGIFIYTLNSKEELILTEANPATGKILGKDYSGCIGQDIRNIFPNIKGTDLIDNCISVAKTGNNWSTTNYIYKDEQISGAYDIHAFRMGPRQVALMFSDITERKQTEQKLQQSEEKHRKIFQNIQDVYFELTPDTIIQEVSPSVSKISRYTREELIGQSIDILTADERIKAFFLELLYSKGELLDFDIPLLDSDGRRVYCAVNVKTETNEKGEIVKIIGSLRDITERKLSREKISKLERAVEQSPSSLMITDLAGKIEYVNPRFTGVTGFSREEVMGQSVEMLNFDREANAFEKALESILKTGKEWKGEYPGCRKDGTKYWGMAWVSPVRNDLNEITHFIVISEDITERKLWEQQLQEAKEKAEESDRLKSAFLANMSHEIRTPMNAILGFSELLRNKDIAELERQEYINLISTKGNDLMGIISDLIDISRIEAGDMQLARTNIHVDKLVSEVFEQTKIEKETRGKDLVHIRKSAPEDPEPIILSDKNRLRQVFTNLLSNALKFTQEGYIEMGYMTRAEEVYFFVRDTGIGIQEDKHEIIFERFRQADDSLSRKYGGTGLGLAISRQIVELLGGRIWVESNPGQGSVFWFSHPIKELTDRTEGLPDLAGLFAEKDFTLKGKKILVAEDDSSNYLFLESLLGSMDAELTWARDGQQAVDIYRKTPGIDLILMDIRMPNLNGLQATKQIRQKDSTVPVIALTAFAFPDDMEKSEKAGCNAHLTKPVKIDELKYILLKYLGGK